MVIIPMNRFHLFRRAIILLIIALTPSLWVGSAAAGNPGVGDMVITLENRELIFFSTLKNGFSEEIIDSIQNGLPIQIVYSLELRRERSIWFDETVSQQVITCSMKYDLLKKEYLLTRDNEGHLEERVTKDFAKLKEWVGQLYKVTLADKEMVKGKGPYHVRVKVEVKTPREPFLLKYVFFVPSLVDFWDGWDESTTFTIGR